MAQFWENRRMRASPRQVHAAAAEVVAVEELTEHALPALESLAGANGSLLYHYEPDGRLAVLGGSLTQAMASHGPELQQSDPTQHVHARFEAGPRIVPASTLAGEAHRRRAAYEAVYGPHDLEHILCPWLTEARPGEPGMTGMLLARARRQGRSRTAGRRRRPRRCRTGPGRPSTARPSSYRSPPSRIRGAPRVPRSGEIGSCVPEDRC